MLKFKPEDWRKLREYLLQWNEWQEKEKKADITGLKPIIDIIGAGVTLGDKWFFYQGLMEWSDKQLVPIRLSAKAKGNSYLYKNHIYKTDKKYANKELVTLIEGLV